MHLFALTDIWRQEQHCSPWPCVTRHWGFDETICCFC